MNKTPTEEAVERLNYIAQRLGEDTFTELLRYYPQATSDDRLRAFAYDFRKTLSELSRLQAERDAAVEALATTRERLLTWPIDDRSTCMCGSPVEGHGYGDGHSPVSVGDYTFEQIIDAIGGALFTLPPPVKEAEPEPVASSDWAVDAGYFSVGNAEAEAKAWRCGDAGPPPMVSATPPDTQARIEALEGAIRDINDNAFGSISPALAAAIDRARAALKTEEKG